MTRTKPAAVPKVGFVSLGCPKALVDSERILSQLRAEGYAIAPSYEAADLVVVNKFEKRGGEDAVRDVRKQVQRNRAAFDLASEQMPVFESRFNMARQCGMKMMYRTVLDSIECDNQGTIKALKLKRTDLKEKEGLCHKCHK